MRAIAWLAGKKHSAIVMGALSVTTGKKYLSNHPNHAEVSEAMDHEIEPKQWIGDVLAIRPDCEGEEWVVKCRMLPWASAMVSMKTGKWVQLERGHPVSVLPVTKHLSSRASRGG